MTQDKRDWQKDKALLKLCQSTATDENEKHALSISIHWLQEAKVYKQSYEATLTDYEAEKARVDAAKELLLDSIGTMMAYDMPAVHINRAVKQFITLYPDTPAGTLTKEVSE